MFLHYFYWQFFAAPRWLVILSWNIQRALYQFFSVSFMVRTLFAHWRRDVVSWHGGSFSQLALTVAWNLISRAIGFVVRFSLLVGWTVVASVALVAALLGVVTFFAWPILAAVSLVAGVVVLRHVL